MTRQTDENSTWQQKLVRDLVPTADDYVSRSDGPVDPGLKRVAMEVFKANEIRRQLTRMPEVLPTTNHGPGSFLHLWEQTCKILEINVQELQHDDVVRWLPQTEALVEVMDVLDWPISMIEDKILAQQILAPESDAGPKLGVFTLAEGDEVYDRPERQDYIDQLGTELRRRGRDDLNDDALVKH